MKVEKNCKLADSLDTISALVMTKNNNLLISASVWRDKFIKIWSIPQKKLLYSFENAHLRNISY